MKTTKTLLILVTVFFVNSLYAATDYNSSRSNKKYSAFIVDETETLIKIVAEETSAVSKSMIAVDQRDEFQGEYLVTVEMRVSLQRCVRVKDQKESVCSDVR